MCFLFENLLFKWLQIQIKGKFILVSIIIQTLIFMFLHIIFLVKENEMSENQAINAITLLYELYAEQEGLDIKLDFIKEEQQFNAS